MRLLPLALVLVLTGCSASEAGLTRVERSRAPSPADVTWRSSAGQAMSHVHPRPLRDETCRQPLRLTAGGSQVRLRLSNALTGLPLDLAAVTVGRRDAGAAVRPDTLLPVTVAGETAFSVPARGSVVTDPVPLETAAGDDLLVSLAVEEKALVAEHRWGAAIGWCSGPGTGNLTGTPEGDAFRTASRAGLVVDDVAVGGEAEPRAVVAVGDSLTDDVLFPVDSHQRWTDLLADAVDRPVVNAAVAGGCVVAAGGYGPALVERFDRDVLSRNGIGAVVVLAGTNDLAQGAPAAEVVAALEQLVDAAEAVGVQVVLSTVPPAAGRSAEQRQARLDLNDWIRSQAHVVDADRLLQDREQPGRLAARYDHGDGLHLSVAGHRVLADAVASALAG